MIGALDPCCPKAVNEPKDLVDALPKLIRSCGSEQHRRELLRFLSSADLCNDEYSLSRLYAVASRVMAEDIVRNSVAAYPCDCPALAARVKILWPARDGLDVRQLTAPGGVLPPTPSREWAEAWFSAAFLNPTITTVSSTPMYHQLLLEQFAFQSTMRGRFELPEELTLANSGPYAVWRLCRNLQRISVALIAPEQRLPDDAAQEADYSGLSEPIIGSLRLLIESSGEVIAELAKGQRMSIALRPVLRVLGKLIDADGLISWIACRYAVTLLECAEGPRFVRRGDQMFATGNELGGRLGRVRAWADLRRSLTPLFRSGIPVDLDRAGRTLASRIVQMDFGRTVPSHIRVNGKLESVPAMLFRYAIEGTAPAFEWISHVPIPRYWLAEMLGADGGDLSQMLRFIASHPVRLGGAAQNLSLLEMRRVVAAVRRSGDTAVAAGALYVLMGSKFTNLVKTRTIVTMLEADAKFADIGTRVFAHQRHVRDSSTAVNEVAEAIVHGRTDVSRGTAVAAARFLAETRSEKLPPLRSLLDTSQT
jgi:hypothetical protein